MLVSDILHSCGNERVAEAAVNSIGGEFADRLRALASRCEHHGRRPRGPARSPLCRRRRPNATGASSPAAMDGKDLPVLCGLRAIVDAMMRNPMTAVYLATLASEAGEDGPVWTVTPDMGVGVLGSA